MNSLAIVIAVCLLGVCAAQSSCSKNGELSPHPSECSMFMICDNGIQRPMNCTTGTVFNPDTKMCDFKHNVPSCQNYQNLCENNPCSAGLYCEVDSTTDLGYICKRVTDTNACSTNPCPATQRCVNTLALPMGYQCLILKSNTGGNACVPNPCARGTCQLSSFDARGYRCV